MAKTPKEDTGFMSKNKYKKEEKHPDIKGTINVTKPGVWELAGWENTNENGKYYSLKLSEPRTQQQQEAF